MRIYINGEYDRDASILISSRGVLNIKSSNIGQGHTAHVIETNTLVLTPIHLEVVPDDVQTFEFRIPKSTSKDLEPELPVSESEDPNNLSIEMSIEILDNSITTETDTETIVKFLGRYKVKQ